MGKGGPVTQRLMAGEHDWLAAVVANLPDHTPKLVYADWLEERGDDRGHFLRAFVAAARSMSPSDFPRARTTTRT